MISSTYPTTKIAAVLVLLYEQEGILRVLLTTRSKELRTHAGQTALPGGKKDAVDGDIVQTAVSPFVVLTILNTQVYDKVQRGP